jgi:excisionase family DNA binding protein
MKQPSKYMTVKQVADYLEVSKQAVNNWVQSGDLKVYRLPSGRIKILRSDFLAYLKQNNLYIDPSFFSSNTSHVVIIDDDKKILDLYRHFFESKNYQGTIDYATDGISGLLKVGSAQAGIVILDIELEGINGIQVCERILHDEALLGVKIFIVSSYVSKYEDRLNAMGIQHRIEKPFSFRTLEEKLMPYLDHD